MATKIKSKGCSLLVSISAVYTAIPHMTDFSVSGERSLTSDTTTLDGGVFKTYDPNGYSEPCTISGNGFYDPDDTVHAYLIGLIAAPAANNFKVTYTDATPLSAVYSGTGVGFDKTVSVGNPVGFALSIQTSGAPST